jgi:hypothetical protein
MKELHYKEGEEQGSIPHRITLRRFQTIIRLPGGEQRIYRSMCHTAYVDQE